MGREPDERAAVVIGHFTAHLATLRQMSLSIAMMLQAGQNPNLEAAVVKDVGTSFEQEIPEVVHALTRRRAAHRLGQPSSSRRSATWSSTRRRFRCAAARAKSCAASSPAGLELAVQPTSRMNEARRTIARRHVHAALHRSRHARAASRPPRRATWPAALWQAARGERSHAAADAGGARRRGRRLERRPRRADGGRPLRGTAALAETMLGRRRSCAEAGLDAPLGPMTVAPVQVDGGSRWPGGRGLRLSGTRDAGAVGRARRARGGGRPTATERRWSRS